VATKRAIATLDRWILVPSRTKALEFVAPTKLTFDPKAASLYLAPFHYYVPTEFHTYAPPHQITTIEYGIGNRVGGSFGEKKSTREEIIQRLTLSFPNTYLVLRFKKLLVDWHAKATLSASDIVLALFKLAKVEHSKDAQPPKLQTKVLSEIELQAALAFTSLLSSSGDDLSEMNAIYLPAQGTLD